MVDRPAITYCTIAICSGGGVVFEFRTCVRRRGGSGRSAVIGRAKPDALGRKVLRDVQSWIFFAGADSTMIGNYLTTYGRKPEQDHQMVMDLGLSWRAYDGGGVEPTSEQPRLSSVSHTGKHRIPILYEREVTSAPPAVSV
ncbi:MAG: hypothetical protein WBD40_02455 [Tepidisphaeraceae bacterium]